MSDVKALKELLIDTLSTQIKDGVTVIDKEGGEHVVDVGAPTLAVAAKVVKDWASDIDAGKEDTAKIEKLSNYLAQRRPQLVQSN